MTGGSEPLSLSSENNNDDGESVSLKQDLHEAVEVVKVSKVFKAHVFVGGALSAASFLIWLFIDFATFNYPWFIFIVSFFALTITFHFYFFIQKRNYLSLHFVWYLNINSLLFFIWLFSGNRYAWFNIPILLWGVLLSWHFILLKFKGKPNRALLMHAAFFILVNLMLFIEWLQSLTIFWFIWPFFGLAIPLVIHYHLHYYHGEWFRLHVALYATVNLMLFFTWAVFVHSFPWWVFPVLGWGVILTVHGFLARPTRQRPIVDADVEEGSGEEYVPPSTPQKPTAPTMDNVSLE